MEIQILGFIFGLYILVLILVSYVRLRNYFHPMVIFPTLEFLSYIPGFLLLKHESSIIFTLDGAVNVVLYEFIYITGAMITMHYLCRKSQYGKLCISRVGLWKIIICFCIGLGAKYIVFQKLGGIAFVILNAQLSYELQSHGFGIYITMYKFMLVAILAMCDRYIVSRSKEDIFLLITMIIIYMFSYLIYTSRTPAFIILLIVLFIFNFARKRFSIKAIWRIKYLIPIFFIILASNYATSQRSSTGDLVSDESPIVDMVRNLSNNGRDMFVYNYFGFSNFWFGEGYANILPALNPLERNKPSLDDGIYLVNLLRGAHVDVNTNFDDLPSQTGSVPFSTPAYMYANFGLMGVIIGGIVMGAIYMLSYNRMLNRMNAFSITIYFLIIYSFGLSTGRMIPTLISIVFILLSEYFLGGRTILSKSIKVQK